MTKEYYQERLTNIMERCNLNGGFLHMTYSKAIESEDFTPCYVDDRVLNGEKAKKLLSALLDDYFEEFSNAKRPAYSYKVSILELPIQGGL